MSRTNELHGVIPAVITPVDDQDRVDEPAIRAVLNRLIAAGVHGLFVGGSSGEGPLLTETEWTRLIEIAHDEVGGRLPLLAGVSDSSTARIKPKIRKLVAIGYEYFVVTPTYYITTKSASEHLRLFGACKEIAGKMSMVAYNNPQTHGSSVSVDTMCEMATRGWIEYCKDSTPVPDHYQRLIEQGRRAGLKVLVGDEASMAAALSAGAVGLVSLCANVDPKTFVQAYEAACKGDWNELAHVQQRIMHLREVVALSGDCWLAGAKYALAALGIGSGKPVSPLEPANEAARKQIDALLRGL